MDASKSKNAGDRQGDRRTLNRSAVKEKTLTEWYEEAMKEKPRDIEEIETGGTTRREAVEKVANKMAPFLISRQEATIKAITKSQHFHTHQFQPTYAQVTFNTSTAVKEGLNATKQTPVLLRRKEATINAIRRAATINTCEFFNNIKEGSVLLHKKEATVNAIRVANQVKTAGSTPPQGEHALHQEAKANPGEDTAFKQGEENQPPKEEEWITVQRKHYMRKAKISRYINPHLEKKIQIFKGQGKCFRCLERGQIQINCRNSIKCYTCNKHGHTSGRCKEKGLTNTNRPLHNNKKSPIENRGEHKPHKNKEQERFERKETNMDNWQTMPMTPTSHLPGARPEQQTVYVPSREGFHPTNEQLDRAAAVHAGPNVNKQTLPQRLATTLAAQLGHHPRAFEVGQLDTATAACIVIFPTKDLRNHAVEVGIFAIDFNTYVQLAE